MREAEVVGLLEHVPGLVAEVPGLEDVREVDWRLRSLLLLLRLLSLLLGLLGMISHAKGAE